MLLMGSLSLAGSVLALLLPETLGEPLIESLTEVEHLGDDGKQFFSWWSTNRVQQQLNAKLEAKKQEHQTK